jgi:hypothetical protein
MEMKSNFIDMARQVVVLLAAARGPGVTPRAAPVSSGRGPMPGCTGNGVYMVLKIEIVYIVGPWESQGQFSGKSQGKRKQFPMESAAGSRVWRRRCRSFLS